MRAEGFGVDAARAAFRDTIAGGMAGAAAVRESRMRASRLLRRDDEVASNNIVLIKTNAKVAWQGGRVQARSSRAPKSVVSGGSAGGTGGGAGSFKGGRGKSKSKSGDTHGQDAGSEPQDKHTRDRDRLLKRLHKSAGRQGKNKGGKGTGQDQRLKK